MEIQRNDHYLGTPGNSFQELISGKIHGVDSGIYTSTKPMNPEALGAGLNALPSSIIRAKGYIYLKDLTASKWKFLFQYTGRNNSLSSRAWSKTELKQTSLVFFGQNINFDQLFMELKNCEV